MDMKHNDTKLEKKKSTAAALNGHCKWRTQLSKSARSGPKSLFFGSLGVWDVYGGIHWC